MKTWDFERSHFGLMRGMMLHALDDFFSDAFPTASLISGDFRPAADICESSSTVTVVLEIPGVARDDIQVSYEDNFLIVTGIRQVPTECNARIHLKEIGTGRFQRKFRIGAGVDVDKIDAELRDGLLVIKLPKTHQDV